MIWDTRWLVLRCWDNSIWHWFQLERHLCISRPWWVCGILPPTSKSALQLLLLYSPDLKVWFTSKSYKCVHTVTCITVYTVQKKFWISKWWLYMGKAAIVRYFSTVLGIKLKLGSLFVSSTFDNSRKNNGHAFPGTFALRLYNSYNHCLCARPAHGAGSGQLSTPKQCQESQIIGCSC